MTQEQYNRYMDGLVLKVASKKLNKTASFRKRAEDYGIIPSIPSTGTGDGSDVYQNLANMYSKEVQDTYDNMINPPKKSWIDVSKDYVKGKYDQGKNWVKAHPYATAGGVATAALAAGLVGAYLLRKKSKKSTKTASFRKRAYDLPLLTAAIEANKPFEQKLSEGIAKAESFNVPTVGGVEIVPGITEHMKYQKSLGKTGLGKIINNIRKDSTKPFNPGTGDILTIGQTPRKFTILEKAKFRAQDAKDYASEKYDQGKAWIKENPVKAGLIGAAAVGIPAALIYAYYSRKNNKSKKSKK